MSENGVIIIQTAAFVMPNFCKMFVKLSIFTSICNQVDSNKAVQYKLGMELYEMLCYSTVSILIWHEYEFCLSLMTTLLYTLSFMKTDST